MSPTRVPGFATYVGVPLAYLREFVSRPHDRWNAINQAMDRYGLQEEDVVAYFRSVNNVNQETVMSKFKVTEKAAKKLLVEMGFQAAPNYTPARLQQRISELDKIADDQAQEKVKDQASFKLLKSVLVAIAKGDEIEVIAEEGEKMKETNGEAEKPKKKGDKPEKTKAEPEQKKGDKPAKDKVKKEKKPGVCAVIKECLEKASSKKPATKDSIHKELVSRFPDRPADGMKSTVGGFPSWGTSYWKLEKGQLATDGEGGYWIKQAGEKAEKPAKKEKGDKPKKEKQAK